MLSITAALLFNNSYNKARIYVFDPDFSKYKNIEIRKAFQKNVNIKTWSSSQPTLQDSWCEKLIWPDILNFLIICGWISQNIVVFLLDRGIFLPQIR